MGILWLYSVHCLLVRQRKKAVDASLPNAKMQFCCFCLTLTERQFSTSTRNRNYIQQKRRYMSVFTPLYVGEGSFILDVNNGFCLNVLEKVGY